MENETTTDTLFDGDIVIRQNRHGYRFSIDSILLTHFIACADGERIIDLGAGNAVMDLILCYRYLDRIHSITAVEIQPSLVELAQHNIRLNRFEQSSQVIHGDIRRIRELVAAGSYSLALCNPPFYLPGCGRHSKYEENRHARHQLNGTVLDFVTACSYALQKGGTAAFVYPAEQSVELMKHLSNQQLEPKQVQFVYNYPDSAHPNAQRILLRAQKCSGPGLHILPPLYVYSGKNCGYSAEVENMYRNNSEFE